MEEPPPFPAPQPPPEESREPSVPPLPQRPEAIGGPLLVGGVMGNVCMAVLYCGLALLAKSDLFRALSVPSMFLVPMVGGVATAWFWRKLQLSLGACALHSLWVTALGLAGAAIVLREGAV